MKRLLLFLLSCLLIVIAADSLFGVFANWYTRSKPLPGDYKNVDYLIKRSNDEVIILGSSIALNSLVPTLLEDSLAMTCFNGGANGQALTFYDTMMECILLRHTPKMFILGLKTDDLAGKGVGGRYNFLVPYYHQGYNTLDSCLEARDREERLLLHSNFYRYNTIWWRILLYHFITPDEPGEKGFVAKGIPAVYPTLYAQESGDTVSSQRKEEFMHMVALCKQYGVQLVVYFPPQYYIYSSCTATEAFVRDYCAAQGIPCFDDAHDSTFLEHKEWFYDNAHLNKVGAPIYTAFFLRQLRQQEENK